MSSWGCRHVRPLLDWNVQHKSHVLQLGRDDWKAGLSLMLKRLGFLSMCCWTFPFTIVLPMLFLQQHPTFLHGISGLSKVHYQAFLRLRPRTWHMVAPLYSFVESKSKDQPRLSGRVLYIQRQKKYHMSSFFGVIYGD